MMISNHEQLLRVFYFLGFGVVLCLYSELFRLWRTVTKPNAFRRFVQDMLLCISSGLGFFLFALAVSGGTLRAAMLGAAALGFAAARLTLDGLRRFVFVPLARFFRPLIDSTRRIGAAMREKGRNFRKKVAFFLKKGLHCVRYVVYNKSAHK